MSKATRELNNCQNYDTFLVLDFEATCEKDKEIEPQEIIEFPCIALSANTCEIEDIFHQYVQPKEIPILTPFCTELTGITQEMVNKQPYFEEVFTNFRKWAEDSGAWHPNNKSIFVTCGDWDLKVMLPKQCKELGIPIPPEMTHWINIKKACKAATGYYGELRGMLSRLNLPHEGRLHSGIDDCMNIVSILKELIRRGFILEERKLISNVGQGSTRPYNSRK